MLHAPAFQFQATAPASAALCRALIVDDMKRILSDPSRWLKDTAARTLHGEVTYMTSRDAHAFDIWGVMYHAVSRHNVPHYVYGDVMDGIAHEIRAITGRPPAPWNSDPSRTHADILELLEALPD
jgi:hypothetical protein